MKKNSAGFTLIEMLLVVAISGILVSMVVVYSKKSESNLLVIREQSRLINTLLRAKSLTIQKFNKPSTPTGQICGYGVHFLYPGQTGYLPGESGYILFQDTIAPQSACDSSDHAYTGVNEDVTKIILDPSIKFGNPQSGSGGIADVIFIPPDPTVQFQNQQTQSRILINTADDAFSRPVSINGAGQVSER